MRTFAAPYEDVWGPRRARMIAVGLALGAYYLVTG